MHKQQITLYFEDVLHEVNELKMLMKWHEVASVLHVSSELLDLYELKIYCKDWRETNMKTLEWKNKMIRMSLQLLSLESRFS
jgi:hypothetical protein